MVQARIDSIKTAVTTAHDVQTAMLMDQMDLTAIRSECDTDNECSLILR